MGEENKTLDAQVRELSESVRALSERFEQLRTGGAHGNSDPSAAPSADDLRRLASQMHSVSPVSPVSTPFSFARSAEPARAPSALVRNDGKFYGDAKWWNAGYARCEILIDTADGRRVFRGEGGGFPGAGAFSGDLYTTDLGRLLSATTTCQIISAAFYVNITFFDANFVLGIYHGGGVGAGGGIFGGQWT